MQAIAAASLQLGQQRDHARANMIAYEVSKIFKEG